MKEAMALIIRIVWVISFGWTMSYALRAMGRRDMAGLRFEQ